MTKLISVKATDVDYDDLHWYAKQVGRSVTSIMREIGGETALRLARSAKRRGVHSPTQKSQEQVRYAKVLEKVAALV